MTELEHELLYEATRSFAVAAEDLKAASASVRRVLDNHGELVAEDAELFDRVKRGLLDSLDKYEKAQSNLFDILI